MWLNTDETLQAATSFLIYNKSKDTRQEIILCKPEIFLFCFHKKMLGNKYFVLSKSYLLSLLHALPDERSGEERALCNNQ